MRFAPESGHRFEFGARSRIVMPRFGFHLANNPEGPDSREGKVGNTALVTRLKVSRVSSTEGRMSS